MVTLSNVSWRTLRIMRSARLCTEWVGIKMSEIVKTTRITRVALYKSLSKGGIQSYPRCLE
jgi:DNA-binding phage protein